MFAGRVECSGAWLETAMRPKCLAWWGDATANHLTPPAPLPTTSGDEATWPTRKSLH